MHFRIKQAASVRQAREAFPTKQDAFRRHVYLMHVRLKQTISVHMMRFRLKRTRWTGLFSDETD